MLSLKISWLEYIAFEKNVKKKIYLFRFFCIFFLCYKPVSGTFPDFEGIRREQSGVGFAKHF